MFKSLGKKYSQALIYSSLVSSSLLYVFFNNLYVCYYYGSFIYAFVFGELNLNFITLNFSSDYSWYYLIPIKLTFGTLCIYVVLLFLNTTNRYLTKYEKLKLLSITCFFFILFFLLLKLFSIVIYEFMYFLSTNVRVLMIQLTHVVTPELAFDHLTLGVKVLFTLTTLFTLSGYMQYNRIRRLKRHVYYFYIYNVLENLALFLMLLLLTPSNIIYNILSFVALAMLFHLKLLVFDYLNAIRLEYSLHP